MKITEGPYSGTGADFIYETLFCDRPDLYKTADIEDPWLEAVLTDPGDETQIRAVIADATQDVRVHLLGYHKLRTMGIAIDKQELLGVVAEVGLEEGLDVMACYKGSIARYINYTGKVLLWETPEAEVERIIGIVFAAAQPVVERIGPWEGKRKSPPTHGNARLTFLVSDGLYFGEGPIDNLFHDQMAGPVLAAMTELMRYIIEKGMKNEFQEV